jgi:hypothetical protein
MDRSSLKQLRRSVPVRNAGLYKKFGGDHKSIRMSSFAMRNACTSGKLRARNAMG